MSRRQRAADRSLLARLVWLTAITAFLGGPAVAAWFNDRPWALPLAAGTLAFGVAGLTLLGLVLGQARQREADRRRLLEQDWGRFSSQEFEHYVAGLFRAQGWQAKVVGGPADGGVDIQLSAEGQKAVVQVKQYLSGRAVSVKEVREFAAVINRAGANEGYFVTAGPFTKPALDWAKIEPMTLVDGDELARWAEETRQNVAGQPGQPGFSLAQWLTLALLAATACGVFSFTGAVLVWG